MSHLFLARQLSTYWCTGHFFFPKRRTELGGVYDCSSSNTTKYDRAEKNKFLFKKKLDMQYLLLLLHGKES